MTAKITAALHQVMSTVGYVQKTGRNDFHKYNYAGEADLLEKLRPAMLDAGLLLLPSVEYVSPLDEHGIVTVKVAYTLAHKDGDVWPDKLYAAGSGGGKNSKGGVDDKGVYKAITGANKYLLFKLFQIATGDDPEDDENTAPSHSQARQTGNSNAPPPSTRQTAPAAGRAPEAAVSRLPAAIKSMQENKSVDALRRWWRDAQVKVDRFEPADRDEFYRLYDAYMASLAPAPDLTMAG